MATQREKPAFLDRHHAGRALVTQLQPYREDTDWVILGIAPGGIAVGAEVARAFEAALEVVVIRPLSSGAGFTSTTPRRWSRLKKARSGQAAKRQRPIPAESSLTATSMPRVRLQTEYIEFAAAKVGRWFWL